MLTSCTDRKITDLLIFQVITYNNDGKSTGEKLKTDCNQLNCKANSKKGISKTSELSSQILNAIRTLHLSMSHLSNAIYRQVHFGLILSVKSCHSLPFLPLFFFFKCFFKNSILSTSTRIPRVEIKLSQWKLGFQLKTFTNNIHFTEHFMKKKIIQEICRSTTVPQDSKRHLRAWKEQCFRYMVVLLSSSFCTLWKESMFTCDASISKSQEESKCSWDKVILLNRRTQDGKEGLRPLQLQELPFQSVHI